MVSVMKGSYQVLTTKSTLFAVSKDELRDKVVSP